LPWWQAYLQSGSLWHGSYLLLVGYAVLSLGSALASGLSDEVSDRAGGKTTMATAWGNWRTRVAVELCVWFGPLAWLVAAAAGAMVPWLAVLASAPVFWFGYKNRQHSDQAVTNAFAAQRRYKQSLHRAIWGGGLAMSAALVLRSLLEGLG
jgi:1,4-dihydroxy-2-naphthoate octaprenyltransferase/chlorophyll synthase